MDEGERSEAAEAAGQIPDTQVSRLPLIVMAAVVALCVLVIVGLGLRGPEEFPAGSPEDGLQQYLDAALDGDEDAVTARLMPELRRSCSTEFDTTYPRDWSSSGIGFALDDMIVDGPDAYADVSLRWSNDGDPFGGSSRTGDHDFQLRQIDGEWFIAEASWPWLVTRCIQAAA